MITTRVIPVSTATSQELLVEVTEKACRPYCVHSSIKPSASVVFTSGAVKVLGGNTIVPITATATIVIPSNSGCGCAHTQVFTETFDVAFNEGTTNVATLAAGSGIIVEPANVKCCKAQSVKITTTLTIDLG